MLMQVEIECAELSGESFDERRYYFFANVLVGERGRVREFGLPFEYTIEHGITLDPRLEHSPDVEVYRRALDLVSLEQVENHVLFAETFDEREAPRARLSLVV